MRLWLAPDPLLLASRSKVRHSLLAAAGIPVEICPADIDERGVAARAPVKEAGALAALLAREKASGVARRHGGRVVLGADQTLALDGQCFAKPPDRAAARSQLQLLRGKTHELHSAVAFVQNDAVLHQHVSVARLTMRTFSERFLDAYLDAAGDTVTESVGAYQLEGVGVALFDRVEGDYFTVLGLPLTNVLQFLRQRGWLLS